jgi:acyl transferase domain-containing protein/NAD(P)-dependent dehydrogenase (short-subunit alcohol dehydrogenase family)
MNSHTFDNVPLAIIGMACRLPGAEDLDAYWQLLVDGRSAIVELPPERFNRSLYHHPKKGEVGKSYSTLGGLVAERPFDREICPLPEEWLHEWDVAHLTMCEVAARACHHAGLNPFDLPSRNVGVFIGHACGSDLAGDMVYATGVEETAEYLRELDDLKRLPKAQLDAIIRDVVAGVRSGKPHRNQRGRPDLAPSAAPLLISRAFGLNGPFMAIEAACASSLQALAVGARALNQGRIDMAIVGGASYCKTDSLVLFSQAQSVSAKGSCPFDANADGLIAAEGYVSLLIKTLPRAVADGDRVYAVIRGIGMSSDGRGRSLWAPRKEGQVEAVRRAYGNSIDPSRLQYLEAHATSTQVGDATELSALSEVLGKYFTSDKRIPIGSVKANIGHTLEVAGMAGLVKAVLAIRHGIIPPSINCQDLNHQVPWDNVPFYVASKKLIWDAPADGHPRRAAVNAFGIGGLNVHIVVDEFQPQQAAKNFAPRNGSQPSVKANSDEAVAIIGAGAILPGASTLNAFWDLLTAGRSAIVEVPRERWNADRFYEPGSRKPWKTPSKLGGFITDYAYDWKKHKVPPKQVANANPLQFMLLDAADQAFQMAGYHGKKFDRSRVGVVVGTLFGGDFSNRLQMGLRLPEFQQTLSGVLRARGIPENQIARIAQEYRETLLEHMPALLDETGSFTSSTLASRITKTFDLMGGAFAIDAGSASSLAALSSSVDLLLNGICDMVVCAGGQRSMDLFSYEGHSLNGLLTSNQPRATFDAAAEGMVPGEGAGVVLLKRLSDARRDGDKVLGIIRGVGAASGTDVKATMKLAIERGLKQAGVSASDVAVLETANAADADQNPKEAAAILETYGAQPRQEPLLVGSTASQTGDLGAVSGIAAVLKASLALEQRLLPAPVALERPLACLAENRHVIQAISKPTPVPAVEPSGRFFAGVNIYSTQTLGYHVIVERGTPVPSAVTKPAASPAKLASPAAVAVPMPTVVTPAVAASSAWRIVRLSGSSPASLAEQAGRLVATSDSLFATAERSHFSASDRTRLAIVADSAATLAAKLKLAAEQLKTPAATPVLEEQGIFCRERLPSPRIAFLFPGQGSQYAGMLSELVRQSPAAAEAMGRVDAAMARLGHPSFAEIAWKNTTELGTDVWRTQVAMLLADMIMHDVLSSWNIRPDCVSGHSYGEFPALVAAGVWSLDQCIRATHARCQAVEASRTGHGALLSTTATPEMVERLSAAINGAVFVSSHNAPDQTVIGGDRDAIREMSRQLESKGFEVRLLPVPRPFHTPLMADVKAPLRQALEQEVLFPPRVPMLSSVTNRYVAEPDDIRDNLVAQMTNPVRYVALVERLVRDGVNVFIEVGPQQVLTRLHRRILGDRSLAIIASDHPKRPGLEQIYRIRALLDCVGVTSEVTTEKVSIPSVAAQTQSVPAASKPASIAIQAFDATARRREKRRQAASGAPLARSAEKSIPSKPTPAVAVAAPPAPITRVAEPVAKTNGHQPAKSSPEIAQPPVAPEPVSSVKTKSGPSPENLELFLINFVVEQTGYPPEIVELDADLEADLGIDSIKKAQLFGELREYFDIQPTSGEEGGHLSLDQFPTLRHVLNFLRGAKPAAASVAAASSAIPAGAIKVAEEPQPAVVSQDERKQKSAPAPAELESFLVNFVVEQTGYPPEIVELDADLEADLGIDSIKKAQLFGELREYFDIQPTGGEEGGHLSLDQFPTLRHVLDFLRQQSGKGEWLGAPAPSTANAGRDLARTEAPKLAVSAVNEGSHKLGPAAEELESFLVNFVVEQTGYPPEIVELDADLEADLGIDSIKKAQLFGELREYFDIQPTGGEEGGHLSLDQFPTLRHVLDFLRGVSRTQEPVDSVVQNLVVAGSNTDMADARQPVSVTGETRQKPAPAAEELESFLVNFVVEQTGYPPDIVELDADLEADLGIDSIKKAQLFGELREYFDIQPTGGEEGGHLSLDQFPTLRHVLNFLQNATKPQAVAGAEVAPSPRTPAIAAASASATKTPTAPQSPGKLNVVRLTGTPYEMGRQHAASELAQIKTILKRSADLTNLSLDQTPEFLEAISKPDLYFGEAELEELRGLADGLGVPLGNVLAHNLALYPDDMPGCTQLAVTARRNDPIGMIHGVNEDLPLALSLPGCLKRIVQVRHPAGDIPHVTFTISGQLVGLNGINARGIAVSSTLMLDRQRRHPSNTGRIHSVTVKNILERAVDIDSAIEIVRSFGRTGAWGLCISHYPTDRLCYIEYDGEDLQIRHEFDLLVTSNHCQLLPSVHEVPQHSLHRLHRLEKLITDLSQSGLTPDQAQAALRDRHDLARGRETLHPTMNTICRVDNQVSIVMQPAAGEIWTTPGPLASGDASTFYKLRLDELFASVEDPAVKASAKEIVHSALSMAPEPNKPTEPQVTTRFVPKMVDAPLATGGSAPPRFHGAALILGDNPSADALERRLSDLGTSVVRLPIADDPAVTLAAIDRVWNEQAAPHLFLVTARDADAAFSLDEKTWSRRREHGVMLPFLVCQRWLQRVMEAGMHEEATVVASTAMGGDFGLSGQFDSVEGGAMSGLLKTVFAEGPSSGWLGLRVKIIDAPAEESPETVAADICRELASEQSELEVGYRNGNRSVVQSALEPIGMPTGNEVKRGGVWVVTGGARGITSHVALELGRRFGLHLHLIGATPLESIDPEWRHLSADGLKQLKGSVMSRAKAAGQAPLDAWSRVEKSLEIDRTLREFSAADAQATYHAVDVADRTALARTLAEIRRTDGPIEGVIHGAGMIKDARFDKKKPEFVQATLAAKVDGVVSLIACTQNDPLKFFIAFGSVTGRFGAAGQSDYGMANDMMCKQMDWLRQNRSGCRAVGIHWHAWGDVGMAVRPEIKAYFEAIGLPLLPKREGIQHLVNELLGGVPNGEVVFTAPEYYRKNYPVKVFADEPSQTPATSLVTVEKITTRLPLVERVEKTGAGLTGTIQFDPTNDPFLIDHRMQGRPFLPAAINVEALAEIASAINPNLSVVRLRNVTMVQGLRFHTDRQQAARVQATVNGQGVVECRVSAEFCDRKGRVIEADRTLAEGTVELAEHATPGNLPKPGEPPFGWFPMEYRKDAHVFHGPRFRGLKGLFCQRDGGFGRIVVQPAAELAGQRGGQGWVVPPGMLDACLVGCGAYTYWMFEKRSEIPHSFRLLELHRPPREGEECVLRVYFRHQDERHTEYDFGLFGADGTLIVSAQGYRGVLLGEGAT